MANRLGTTLKTFIFARIFFGAEKMQNVPHFPDTRSTEPASVQLRARDRGAPEEHPERGQGRRGAQPTSG